MQDAKTIVHMKKYRVIVISVCVSIILSCCGKFSGHGTTTIRPSYGNGSGYQWEFLVQTIMFGIAFGSR